MIRRVPFPDCRSGVIGPAIADNPENDGHLSPWQEAIEVVPVALGVLEARPAIDLLMTEVAMGNGMPCTVALTVRRLLQGVGFVFMTGRPQLIGATGEMRDKAFVKPVDLADLPQEIRHRLTE